MALRRYEVVRGDWVLFTHFDRFDIKRGHIYKVANVDNSNCKIRVFYTDYRDVETRSMKMLFDHFKKATPLDMIRFRATGSGLDPAIFWTI